MPIVDVDGARYVQVLRPLVQHGERIPVPHKKVKDNVAPVKADAVRVRALSQRHAAGPSLLAPCLARRPK